MSALEQTSRAPFVLIEDGRSGETLSFTRFHHVLEARTFDDVPRVLAAMLDAQNAGYYLAGYAAYELGYFFEPRLAALAPKLNEPLLHFGIFDEPNHFDWDAVRGAGDLWDLSPAWTLEDYEARFRSVIAYIRSGDIYQANLTFPMRGTWSGDPVALFAALRSRQPAPYGALVALGADTILSLSPELFFEAWGSSIRTRPMKGTAPRHAFDADDLRSAEELASSVKNRAENLMIVDLLRNDLSRVSEIGSVRVSDLFTVERYPTLFQMTSGIEAQLQQGIRFPDLLRALFPCGSVTGAPKIRAMEVIRQLEEHPRGVYCGGIGMLSPQGEARFSVAIRTLTLNASGAASYNVGSGLVFDSEVRSEYEECLLKAAFLGEGIVHAPHLPHRQRVVPVR